VVKSEPPDSRGSDVGRYQVANGLVERGGLPDTARPENQLESMRIVVMQTLPEELGQGPFDRTRQGGRHLACPLPRVLFVEDPL
jgi:hypothetical protein